MKLTQSFTYWTKYWLIGRAALWLQKQRWRRYYRNQPQDPNSPLFPQLQATADMKALVSKHYLEGHYVQGVKKVAWVTSGAPIEVLRALDYFILYPEKHAAICGARKMGAEFCAEAEKRGFSQDLCSYARTDFGSLFSGKTPVGRLPRPDVLVACTNICQTVVSWYQVLAFELNIPLILIDTPFLYGEVKPHQLAYAKRQIEESIPELEKIAGRTLDYKKLQQIVSWSKEAAELWLAVLNCGRHKPAPITAFDEFIHLAPIVDQRGKPETIHYYRTLLTEVEERVKRGIGAVRKERKRLLWDNLPIWFRIRAHSEFLAQKGVNVVISTYAYAWGELAPLMDSQSPLESMAKIYLHPILNRSSGQKLSVMQQMIREFSLDGAILHSDRSCKPYSLGQMDQRTRLVQEIGVPALLLEADHNDARAFSDAQAQTRLEAFVEALA